MDTKEMKTILPKVRVYSFIGRSGEAVRNQYKIHTNNAIYFQSYSTLIGCRYEGKIYLDLIWDCSRTTLKYLSQWLGRNTKEIRQAIKTGEYTIVDLNDAEIIL